MKFLLIALILFNSYADDLLFSNLKKDNSVVDHYPVGEKRTFYVLKSSEDNTHIFSLNESLAEQVKDRLKEDSKVITSFSIDLGENLAWSYGPSFPCLHKNKEVLAIFEKKSIKERESFKPIEAYSIDKDTNIFTRVKLAEVECRWRPKAGEVFPKIWLK